MNIPREDRELVREDTFTFAVTKKEKDMIKKAADNMGMSMSTFARMAIKSKIGEVV